jgi:surfeit locus 1 family protein
VSRAAPGWRFWLATLAALAGVALTVSLGAWQLSRASFKEALQARVDAQHRLAPLDASALQSGAPFHRQVIVQGTWLAQHTVFLDNRQMNGKPGFNVLTPLQLEGGGAVVLVQRGWSPRNFADRAALPKVETPDGRVTVQGRIAPAPAKLYDFAGAPAGPIRQNLDLGQFSAETRLPLLPVTVLQTGEASEGLLRQWAEPATGVDKHYGYAFQWFGLGGLIFILYVWFQIVRRFFFPPRAAR